MDNLALIIIVAIIVMSKSKNSLGSAVNIYFGTKIILNIIGLLVLIISGVYFAFMLF